MTLSNSDRQEMETIVRAALEPALHQLEVRIAKGFAEACDMWANLLADLLETQTQLAMNLRDRDREKFLAAQREMADKQDKRAKHAKHAKVGGFGS